MPRGRQKITVKATKPVPEPKEPHFMDHEIIALEQQIGAIRAVKEVKTEHLLTDLRYLRSCFREEQLQKPMLEIFEETLPNLSIVNDKGSNKFEVVWKDKESLLQRLSMAYPHFSYSIPPFAGAFEYSSNAIGRTSFIGADNLYLKDFVLEEPSETQTLAMQEGLQTPGVTSQRLSVGMMPKTLRVPKPGEMLLSVHGSPPVFTRTITWKPYMERKTLKMIGLAELLEGLYLPDHTRCSSHHSHISSYFIHLHS